MTKRPPVQRPFPGRIREWKDALRLQAARRCCYEEQWAGTDEVDWAGCLTTSPLGTNPEPSPRSIAEAVSELDPNTPTLLRIQVRDRASRCSSRKCQFLRFLSSDATQVLSLQSRVP